MTTLESTVCVGLECMSFDEDEPPTADVVLRVSQALKRHPALAVEIVSAACVLAARSATTLDELRGAIERIAADAGSRA